MNNMVLMEVVAEPSFWVKHLFDILTIGIGLAFTIALYIWAFSKKSHQLRMYIPTIWTSLGILFTFISIYNGLTDKELLTDVSKGQIENLIGRIIPAFSTSIIGIIGAIICSIINKGLLASVEDDGTATFNRLRRQLNEKKQLRFGNEHSADSPELLLFEIISAVNQEGKSIEDILAKNQTSTTGKSDEIYRNIDGLLNKLNNNTNKAITDSFLESLDSIQQEFSGLKTKLEDLTGETHTALNNAMKEQGKSFKDEIVATRASFVNTLQQQNETLVEQLGKLNDLLGQKIQSMQQSNKDTIVAFVRDVKHDFVTVVKENIVKESEQRTEQLKGFISDENIRITQFVEKQEELYQCIKEGMEKTVSDIRKLFDEEVKQTIEQFAEKQHEISATTIELCNTKLVEDSNEYLKNHTGMMSVYLTKLEKQTNYTCDRFLDSVEILLKTIKSELDELHKKDSELIGTTIKENEGNVNRLLGENKSAIEAIANGIKEDYENIKTELQASQDRWKGQAEEIEKANLAKIENIQGETEKKVQAINAAITTLGEGLQTSFDSVKDEIKSSIENNKTNLETLLSANEQSIKRVSDEIKSDNGSIVEELAKAQKGWKEAAEDMERKHQGEVIKIKEKAQQDILKISDAIIRIESTLQQSLNNIAENITKSISEFNSKQDSIKTDAVKQNEELLQDVREQISKSFQINTLQTATGELVNSINGTLNRFNSETNRITGSLSDVEKSIKESSDKYAEAIRNYDEKVKYIGSVIDLFKAHITDMALLQNELEKLNANQVVKELKDDAAQKHEEKQKSHKH